MKSSVNKGVIVFSIIVLSLMFVSCKKDSETTLNYMKGTILIDLPYYTFTGDSITITISGITEPIEDSITYTWLPSKFNEDTLYGKSVKVGIPDQYGTYTLIVQAGANDYYSLSSSKSTIAIDTTVGGSFEGFDRGNNIFKDNRDNQFYFYSHIGSLDWFTQNLNWKESGKPYLDAEAVGYIYGRLYTWEEATDNICPPGWRLPDNEDWEELGKLLNNNTSIAFDSNWSGLGGKVTFQGWFNEISIWKYSPNHTLSNLYKWSAMPAGNAQNDYSKFRYIREYGFWWSATQYDSNNAYYRYIYYDNSDFPYNYTNKSDFAASVRCVRDNIPF